MRVNTEEETVRLRYQAMVRQNTGEDWREVELALSTAQPHISSNPPEINPLKLYRYIPSPVPVPKSQNIRLSRKASAGGSDMTRSAPAPMMEAAEAAPMRKQKASVQKQTTAARFLVEGQTTIPSDNQPHQSLILDDDLEANFSYLAVPRLAPQVYLLAEITNTSEYPLLAGESSIFLDGHFTAKGHLKAIAPGESFENGLGVDPSVKVKLKPISNFRGSQGFLMGKKHKKTYAYEIELHNHKTRPIQLEIKDRYPLSEDEEIKVELISPPANSVEIDEQHLIKWELSLGSGEEKKLRLEYAVSFGKDIRVEGLE